MPMTRMPAAAMTLLLVGCSAVIPSDVYLPTYGPLNGLPAALLEGTLIEDDGCLWIESERTRWLVLWPRGSAVVEDAGERVVRNGGQRAVIGTRVSAGGGEYGDGHYEFVVELIGEQISAPCREAGLYWLGYEVQTLAQ